MKRGNKGAFSFKAMLSPVRIFKFQLGREEHCDKSMKRMPDVFRSNSGSIIHVWSSTLPTVKWKHSRRAFERLAQQATDHDSPWRELNSRALVYKTSALTTELQRLVKQ
ncbi:hypothetical protein M513_11055 [Trichuris suis]|uniref:Uncharacterized protein n=1 Tax=Trichuris suis TaxID=68888 RepID=A0A085LST9_9BILA|nr:hypothetical protein M513_11055 [Trichuris suis]